MLLRERFQINRPLEEMEVALVRAATLDARLVTPPEEAVLRTALSLARLYRVRSEGREVGVGAFLAPFREHVTRLLTPVLLGSRAPARERLLPLVGHLRGETLKTRDELLERFSERLPAEAILKEVREKALVLVAGGGGGSAYVYLGSMALLEEYGLRPALMAGTSMGAILCLFRSRMPRFDQTEMVNIVRGLSWRKLFRVISTENRYGLPAALRLFLRAGIGRWFNAASDGGGGVRLNDLPTPTIVSVSGIRRGMLPHPVEFYERLLNVGPMSLFEPVTIARKVQEAMGAVAEFFTHPEIMEHLTLGLDEGTEGFDAVDAVGFSSALPGVIHYDVLREDVRMREMLDGLFERRGLFRLIDGGLTNNLPAKAAWRAVHKGHIGTRNAFILGLNGFSPKLTTPLWLPLERLAALTVQPNRPYAHMVKDFKRSLSPLELVPSLDMVAQAMELGRRQLNDDMPFIRRMLAPLPMI